MYAIGGGAVNGVLGGAALAGNGLASKALPFTGFAFGAYLAAVAGLVVSGAVLQAIGRRTSS